MPSIQNKRHASQNCSCARVRCAPMTAPAGAVHATCVSMPLPRDRATRRTPRSVHDHCANGQRRLIPLRPPTGCDADLLALLTVITDDPSAASISIRHRRSFIIGVRVESDRAFFVILVISVCVPLYNSCVRGALRRMPGTTCMKGSF